MGNLGGARCPLHKVFSGCAFPRVKPSRASQKYRTLELLLLCDLHVEILPRISLHVEKLRVPCIPLNQNAARGHARVRRCRGYHSNRLPHRRARVLPELQKYCRNRIRPDCKRCFTLLTPHQPQSNPHAKQSDQNVTGRNWACRESLDYVAAQHNHLIISWQNM